MPFPFLYRSGPLPDLHSFPTRRSSDLAASLAEMPLRSWQGHLLDADRRPKDRQSTRLNSSHMSISYAVFCLKKKKRLTLFSSRDAFTRALPARTSNTVDLEVSSLDMTA